MKDYVIHSIAWQFADDSRSDEVARDMIMAYTPLMRWLNQEELISNPALQDKPVDSSLEIRASDLTTQGLELFKLSHQKWLQSLDRIPIGDLTEEEIQHQKIPALIELVRQNQQSRIIIFAENRATVENITTQLNNLGERDIKAQRLF